MKDLKHLFYFENLLQEANNELVQQAKKEGKLAIGYTCFHMPEVLLNVDNCFSLRMRAPRTGSLEIATYQTIPVSIAAPFWSGQWRAATISWTV